MPAVKTVSSDPGGKTGRIGIVAGEASGDLHGSNLVAALRASGRKLEFFGLGGPRMEQAGVAMVHPPPLNVVGFTEVLVRVVQIYRAYRRMQQALVRRRADLLILIDYPDFNLRLARYARGRRIPVLFYISPQVWAWRPGRVKVIARTVDRLAVILPFEEEFYRRRGVQVEFVGHPLLDVWTEPPGGLEVEERSDDGRRPWGIGLLPGSRPAELQRLLPLLLDTARHLRERSPRPVRFLLPVAPTLDKAALRKRAAPHLDPKLEIRFLEGAGREFWGECDLALVASGTATLEAAIAGVPAIIVYKVSPLNFWLAKRLVKVPYIGLVNWIAGRKIIPEFIQDQATAEALTGCALDLLSDPARREQLHRDLAAVRQKLGGPGASGRVAGLALEMMSR